MISDNLTDIFCEIKNGNNLGEHISLVGAIKMQSVEDIQLAIDSGLKIVAENKVQEFNEKHGRFSGAEEHVIGHLQTNKVKYIVGKVSLIHSVDSIDLIYEINKQAKKRNIVQDILLQINIGKEETKSGFSLDETEDVLTKIKGLEYINVVGLMAMLINTADENVLQNLCLKMRQKYDKLILDGYKFKYLSIGMSNDYKIAIKNGSNMIRIGSKIFGKRNYGGNN